MTDVIRGKWIFDPDTGVSVPADQYIRRVKKAEENARLRSDLPAPQIMKDIEPFINVAVDGKEISSRSAKREMMKRNNLVEIGTDFRPTKRVMKKRTKVRESMKRVLYDHGVL